MRGHEQRHRLARPSERAFPAARCRRLGADYQQDPAYRPLVRPASRHSAGSWALALSRGNALAGSQGFSALPDV